MTRRHVAVISRNLELVMELVKEDSLNSLAAAERPAEKLLSHPTSTVVAIC